MAKNLNLKELIMLEGEEVIYYVEGNAYTDSSNPLTKLLAAVIRIFWMIFGIKLRTYLIATNIRIVRVDKKTILWGFIPSDVAVITINKNSVQSVGYAKEVRWFIFPTSYFMLTNITETIKITYSGSSIELSKIVAEFSRLVSK